MKNDEVSGKEALSVPSRGSDNLNISMCAFSVKMQGKVLFIQITMFMYLHILSKKLLLPLLTSKTGSQFLFLPIFYRPSTIQDGRE